MSENDLHEQAPSDIVYDIACLSDTGLCFAARASGLYRSIDGGASWEFAYASLELSDPLPTTSVAISPDFSEDHTVFAGVAGGMMVSTDGGVTWTPVGMASPPPAVSAVVVSPAYRVDGVLLAASTGDGIFRCANRGLTWSRWNFGLLDLNVFCLAISPDFANDETLYAGVETGIFRSTSGGRAWREVDLPIGFEPVLSLALSPHFAQDGTIFAGTENQGVLRSLDRGKTWQRLGEEVFTSPVNRIVISPAYPERSDVLAVMDEGLLLSRDAGVTWQPVRVDVDDITTALAPHGLHLGAPLLLGTAHGAVLRSRLELA